MDAGTLSAIGSISSAGTAAVALGVAVLAWRTAKSSAQAAEALTRIEADRLHAEMRPQLRVTAETLGDLDGGENSSRILYVKVVGPPALEYLDTIDVKILPLEVPVASEAGKIEYEEENWPFLFVQDPPEGPYSTQERIGKIRVSQRRGCFMVTPPDADWLIGIADDQMEVELTCRREGLKPWITTTTVEIPGPGEDR